MRKPRATREYEAICFESRPIEEPDRVERSACDRHRIDAGAQPVVPALCHQTVHDVCARASREEIPRFWFEEKRTGCLQRLI